MKGWAIWITGLPGCGKTERAKQLLKKLEQKNIRVQYLRMDEIRKILTPEKRYTEEERDHAYRAIILIGKFLTENGINVIIDATGHKKVWRELARKLIPNFAEVYIKCPLETCVDRESKRKDDLIVSNLYKKAMERIKSGERIDGVEQMVGIDVPYENSENPELMIDSDKLNIKESSDKIFQMINHKFIKR